MKIYLKWLVTTLLIFITNFSFSQGKDVIFLVDNSTTISSIELDNISQNIAALSTNILNCPDNRVALVHYGEDPIAVDAIFIESDFNNNPITQNLTKRLRGDGDFLHESVKALDDAIFNVQNISILGNVNNLTPDPNNSLHVIIFTDAERSTGSTFLVNSINSSFGSDAAFNNFTILKQKNISFTMVYALPRGSLNINPIDVAAAASIASKTPNAPYTGTRENYPADPDNTISNPNYQKSYYQTDNFVLARSEIENISLEYCVVLTPPCEPITNIRIENDHILNWDSNATNFVFEWIEDSRCDGKPYESNSNLQMQSINLSTSSVDLRSLSFFTISSGFRYRIRAENCDDWTEWCCIQRATVEPRNNSNTFFSIPNICFPPGPCDDFTDTLNIPNDHISTTEVFDQVNNIFSDRLVNGRSNVQYRASEQVVLLPGFKTINGAVFLATIDPCDPIETASKNQVISEVAILYPNPSSDFVTVLANNRTVESYLVYDILGKNLVEKEDVQKSKIVIPITQFIQGNYFVKIKFKDGSEEVLRFIKE